MSFQAPVFWLLKTYGVILIPLISNCPICQRSISVFRCQNMSKQKLHILLFYYATVRSISMIDHACFNFLGIHTTKTLPIDSLYKITAHLTPFSRLLSNWLSQVWYHFEDWDHNSSTNMKKPYDGGYFFEIQSLEEMHALNAYLPISKCFYM